MKGVLKYILAESTMNGHISRKMVKTPRKNHSAQRNAGIAKKCGGNGAIDVCAGAAIRRSSHPSSGQKDLSRKILRRIRDGAEIPGVTRRRRVLRVGSFLILLTLGVTD